MTKEDCIKRGMGISMGKCSPVLQPIAVLGKGTKPPMTRSIRRPNCKVSRKAIVIVGSRLLGSRSVQQADSCSFMSAKTMDLTSISFRLAARVKKKLKCIGNNHEPRDIASTVRSNRPAPQSRGQQCHHLSAFSCPLIKCRYSKLHAGVASSRSDFDCYWHSHCSWTRTQGAPAASECFYSGLVLTKITGR